MKNVCPKCGKGGLYIYPYRMAECGYCGYEEDLSKDRCGCGGWMIEGENGSIVCRECGRGEYDSIAEVLTETSEDFSMKLANGKLDISLVWRVIEPPDEALWYLNLVLQNNGWL